MCGIAGFIGTGLASRRHDRRLGSSRPDGEGFFIDPDAAVYFGHRRLAIIDVEADASRWRTKPAPRPSSSTAKSTITATCDASSWALHERLWHDQGCNPDLSNSGRTCSKNARN